MTVKCAWCGNKYSAIYAFTDTHGTISTTCHLCGRATNADTRLRTVIRLDQPKREEKKSKNWLTKTCKSIRRWFR